jgi:hypothetical protein
LAIANLSILGPWAITILLVTSLATPGILAPALASLLAVFYHFHRFPPLSSTLSRVARTVWWLFVACAAALIALTFAGAHCKRRDLLQQHRDLDVVLATSSALTHPLPADSFGRTTMAREAYSWLVVIAEVPSALICYGVCHTREQPEITIESV